MSVITITVKEYCTLAGYSVRNVTKHLNNGTLLPFMRNIRKSGATWLVDVMKDWYDSKHCDVCGSTKLVEYTAMGVNCENCHPLKK